MNEEDTIDQVFKRYSNLTNEVSSLIEYLSDNLIIKEFLWCLFPKYEAIAMLIMERDDFEEMSPLEVLGILGSYEKNTKEMENCVATTNFLNKNLSLKDKVTTYK